MTSMASNQAMSFPQFLLNFSQVVMSVAALTMLKHFPWILISSPRLSLIAKMLRPSPMNGCQIHNELLGDHTSLGKEQNHPSPMMPLPGRPLYPKKQEIGKIRHEQNMESQKFPRNNFWVGVCMVYEALVYKYNMSSPAAGVDTPSPAAA